MLWMLLMVARVKACEIQSDSSLLVCSDLSAFHLANYSSSTHTLELEQCRPSPYAVSSSAVKRVNIKCSNSSLPAFAVENFSGLTDIELSSCSLSEIRWQSLYVDGKMPSVDLGGCPLDCSCTNGWLSHTQDNSAYAVSPVLPDTFRCSFLHCNWGTLTTTPFIECCPGDTVTIDVHISAPASAVFAHRKYFSWHAANSEFNFTENVVKDSAHLVIDDVTEAQLGMVTMVCWHCDYPLMTTVELKRAASEVGRCSFGVLKLSPQLCQGASCKVELRVRVPLRARLEDRGDSHLIVISGWPIDPLNLTAEWNGQVETRNLSEHSAVIFFGNLVVRPDKGQSLFYRRVYSVFALACSDCPVNHPAGNYSFDICSTISCSRLLNFVEHIGNNSETWTVSFVTWPTATTLAMLFILATILVIILLRFRVIRSCRTKIFLIRKRTIHERVESRRTSRVTEETLLRLEERSSLSSSDYSNQIIPFIELGTIQIHECIGKGAFGEVYCGTWEKTGERSVAIKAIKADEDVEKEALVLSRLEHCNIVRLYGMARDGSRLLLVFERMNLGDLRTYLRHRAPTLSSYSQFPPALVEDELRLIVRQIVSGLCYLTSQQVVHRDLAARNCLVSGESDLRCCLPSQRPPITVKISDFGMSRRLYGQADYYRMQNHTLLPVRWLPPEAINDCKFSASSDVWALGVTIWEVFSYGEVPFAELNNFEVVSCAMAGIRPPRPKCCPLPMYKLMQRCWAVDPDERIRPEEVLLDPCLTPTLTDFIDGLFGLAVVGGGALVLTGVVAALFATKK